MDISIGSTGATASAVKRAAGSARAAQWARWTVTLPEEPPEGGFARFLAWRLLTRAPLVPVGPDMEQELRGRLGARAFVAAGAVHRLQCAMLLAGTGIPVRLDGDLARTKAFSSGETAWLYEAARRDLAGLLGDLSRLYPGETIAEDETLFVSWTGDGRPGRRIAWVGDGGESRDELLLTADPVPFVRDDAALASLARRLFGVPGLRPGQAEAAAALLSGRDLSLTMPTGAGKSLVFHLAAMLSPGTTVVLAPLRALLRDQARRLAEAGAGPVGLLVGDDKESTQSALTELAAGRLRVALAAPERLDSRKFRDALRGAAETSGVSLIVIDEAHCAARRGHDWRPSYRALGARVREWSSSSGAEPALAAVSAGASSGAHAEAERALGLREPVRVRAGRPRENLSFRVWTSAAPDHAVRLRELLTRVLPDGRFGPGIVFCPRVDGPLGAATLAAELVWSEGIDAAAYTGRPPIGADAAKWSGDKMRAAEEFLSGRRGLLCATRAFGLGVDRSDVRFVIHLGLPASLEEYFQQAGRAGRDGQPAECWILLQCLSVRRARRWASLPLERLRSELAALRPDERDDVSRAYALHLSAFPGAETERREAEVAWLALGAGRGAGPAELAMPHEDMEALTRALLRLEDCGALRLRERCAAGWRLELSGGRETAAVLRAVDEAVARDYGAVEPSRRASLAELVELALAPDAGAALAGRLTDSPRSLRYSASYSASAGPQEESLAMAVARAAGKASGWR
jgi:RecQ family ATP-dependent DNA helicase